MDDVIASGYRDLTLLYRRSDIVIVVNSVVICRLLLTSDWKSLSYRMIWIIKHKNSMYDTISSPVCNEGIIALSSVSDCCLLVSCATSVIRILCHLRIISCSWSPILSLLWCRSVDDCLLYAPGCFCRTWTPPHITGLQCLAEK